MKSFLTITSPADDLTLLSVAEMRAAVASHVPMGRIGSPEDMAGAAIFLASRAGDYVLGHTLVVDGGLHIV